MTVNKSSKIILLNKPFNVLCQFSDNEGRATLADYIDTKGVYPAGRLDRDSEGLVLLTDDGKLQHRIAHPDHKLEKTYWVQVEGVINQESIGKLQGGLKLKDGDTKPAKVRKLEASQLAIQLWPRNPPIRQRANIPTSWLELIITEGRNRQVRRMTAAVGFPTLRLIRMAIGDWNIEGLDSGESRQLTVHLPSVNPKRSTGAPNKRSTLSQHSQKQRKYRHTQSTSRRDAKK